MSDPRRLLELQQLCATQLAARGLADMQVERMLPGAFHAQRWDVVGAPGQVPVAVSLKAMSASRAKNARNRLKEMLGEAANAHQANPQAVLGYLAVLVINYPARLHHTSVWTPEHLGVQFGRQCDRARPEQAPHLFEAGCVLALDVAARRCQAIQAPGLLDFNRFLDRLAHLQSQRTAAKRRCERRVRRLPPARSMKR